jgi:hypothetical protein
LHSLLSMKGLYFVFLSLIYIFFEIKSWFSTGRSV